MLIWHDHLSSMDGFRSQGYFHFMSQVGIGHGLGQTQTCRVHVDIFDHKTERSKLEYFLPDFFRFMFYPNHIRNPKKIIKKKFKI